MTDGATNDTATGQDGSAPFGPANCSVLVAVLHKNSKQVTRRLTAKQVRHRKLKGYWGWKLAAFNVPKDSLNIIADLVLENPDTAAGCDWLGRPIAPNAPDQRPGASKL